MIDILFIDDDETFGQLMLERFENTCWRVQFHHGPFGTLNAIRAARPSLVVLDVNMPGLSGPQLHDLARKAPELANMRVMFYSSLDQRDLEQLVREHNADAALPKSSTRAQFMHKVSELLNR